MAKPTIQTGANSTLVYRWEDEGFKTDPADASPKTFGKNSTLSAFDGSRNAVELFQPNTREVEQFIEQQFSGSWTADFTLGNPWFNRAVIDTPSSTGAAAPYSHEYDGEDPDSIQIVTGNTRSGEDWLIRGAFVANATISIDVPGNVTVSLSGAYAALEETTPGTQDAQVTFDTVPHTFKHASLSIGGTVQRLVQSATLTINQNADPVLEMGAEEAVDFSPGGRLLTLDHVQTRDDESDDAIDRFLGGSTLSTPDLTDDLVLTIDNGETDDAKQSLTYTLTGALGDEFSVAGTGNPDENIENSVTNRPAGLTALAENSEAEAL